MFVLFVVVLALIPYFVVVVLLRIHYTSICCQSQGVDNKNMYFVTYHKNEVFNLSTINRIIELAKARGLKQTYLCSQLGLERSWLQNVKRHNSIISDERLVQLSDILDTTVAYLKGETDDPTPDNKKSPSITDELMKRSDINELLEKYELLTPDKRKMALDVLRAWTAD